MDRDSAIGAWESMVQELLAKVDISVATVPKSEAALPDGPIYDSSRSYA
ncbi:hypothetical protein C481_19821, partial [Natrialba asiatica DSM 12278]